MPPRPGFSWRMRTPGPIEKKAETASRRGSRGGSHRGAKRPRPRVALQATLEGGARGHGSAPPPPQLFRPASCATSVELAVFPLHPPQGLGKGGSARS